MDIVEKGESFLEFAKNHRGSAGHPVLSAVRRVCRRRKKDFLQSAGTGDCRVGRQSDEHGRVHQFRFTERGKRRDIGFVRNGGDERHGYKKADVVPHECRFNYDNRRAGQYENASSLSVIRFFPLEL